MDTIQPDWELIANLGDADPIEHGGVFVYRDRTGVYTEECEILEPDESGRARWTVYRFALDRCTLVDGVLSDNAYHPECGAWFDDDLAAVAGTFGVTLGSIQADFCSADPIRRAHAYRTVGKHHGWENLDEYPITIADRSEIEERYREAPTE
jgi:hypothetical protein